MPITELQAVQWAGPATADQLTTLQSPLTTGRLTASNLNHMLTVSSGVAHCFVPGGAQPPILSPSRQAAIWCHQILRRDATKRETVDVTHNVGLAHRTANIDTQFLMGFGTEDEITSGNGRIPFLRLMFDPETAAQMHAYIKEAVDWMMRGGTVQSNLRPLLWAGLRDWDSSSAWTRGVVLLYARWYKKLLTDGHQRHIQQQNQIMNSILMDFGCHPEQQLLSLSHLPSLTARQARRSGVSQRALAERWA